MKNYLNENNINLMYRQIQALVLELLDNVSQILRKNGIKYFQKPSCDLLMRLISPFELKAYASSPDFFYLFQDYKFKTFSNLNENKHFSNMNQEKYKKLDGQQKFNYLRQQKIMEILNDPSNPLTKLRFNKRQKQKQMKKINRNIIQQILRHQLYQWGREQISKGRNITRLEMKQKAMQIAQRYNTKFGERWINTFISRNNQLRNMVTHRNCSDIKKKSPHNEAKDDQKIKQNWHSQCENALQNQQQQYDGNSAYQVGYSQVNQQGYENINHRQIQVLSNQAHIKIQQKFKLDQLNFDPYINSNLPKSIKPITNRLSRPLAPVTSPGLVMVQKRLTKKTISQNIDLNQNIGIGIKPGVPTNIGQASQNIKINNGINFNNSKGINMSMNGSSNKKFNSSVGKDKNYVCPSQQDSFYID